MTDPLDPPMESAASDQRATEANQHAQGNRPSLRTKRGLALVAPAVAGEQREASPVKAAAVVACRPCPARFVRALRGPSIERSLRPRLRLRTGLEHAGIDWRVPMKIVRIACSQC
jgi:hypothetical protein